MKWQFGFSGWLNARWGGQDVCWFCLAYLSARFPPLKQKVDRMKWIEKKKRAGTWAVDVQRGDSTFIILNVSLQWKIRNVLRQYCVCFVYSGADQMTVVLILLQRVSMWWCSSMGERQCGVGLSLCQKCVHDFCMYRASLCNTPLRFLQLVLQRFCGLIGD